MLVRIVVRIMEDPYENGEGPEVWSTRECIGTRRIPTPVPRYYQRVSLGSRESSRSGTPVEPDSPRLGSSPRLNGSPRLPGRGNVYVLPSPPLKRWLRDQGKTHTDDAVDFVTEEEFERMFTIRRSDWIFQFSEYPLSSPSMTRIGRSLLDTYNLHGESQLLMIYFSDARSPVAKIEGCRAAEGGGTVGIRGSLLRYMILTLSYKGIKVKANADDTEAYCMSRVECSPRCLSAMKDIRTPFASAAWVSFVLEPSEKVGTARLRVLAHALC